MKGKGKTMEKRYAVHVCMRAGGGVGVGPAQAQVQARGHTQMSFLRYDLQFLKTGPLIGLELAKLGWLTSESPGVHLFLPLQH